MKRAPGERVQVRRALGTHDDLLFAVMLPLFSALGMPDKTIYVWFTRTFDTAGEFRNGAKLKKPVSMGALCFTAITGLCEFASGITFDDSTP